MMRFQLLAAGTLSLLLGSAAFGQVALTQGGTQEIWKQKIPVFATDLVRFKDQWYCALYEGSKEYSADGAVRLISSPDGKTWKSLNVFKSDTPARGLYGPKLAVAADGRLVLTAMGAVHIKTGDADYHNRYLMVWTSKNGKTWDGPQKTGDSDFLVSSVRVHKGKIYCYGKGSICGIAQTIQIRSSDKGKKFDKTFEETFRKFFPGRASLAFSGDRGYCFMGRSQTGYLGMAKAPYTDWTWQDLNVNVRNPNSVRLPGGEILVSTGFRDEHVRTSLCWFDQERKELVEVFELPTEGQSQMVGLFVDDKDLVVTHHDVKDGTARVHWTRLKIENPQ